MSDYSKTLLLIEDDLGMLEMLQGMAAGLGYSIKQIHDGLEGYQEAVSANYPLVIVDCNLPQMSGFDICRKLRLEKPAQPMIMLTSRKEEIDRVLGLELGADDFVTKPFSVRELGARIRNLLSRVSLHQASTEHTSTSPLPPLVFGKLKIDQTRRIVTLEGEKIEFTALEYDLLHFLASNPGVIFSRQELMEKVWGTGTSKMEPTVTVTMCRIRSKLESDAHSQEYIHSVRGAGYRFIDAQYQE